MSAEQRCRCQASGSLRQGAKCGVTSNKTRSDQFSLCDTTALCRTSWLNDFPVGFSSSALHPNPNHPHPRIYITIVPEPSHPLGFPEPHTPCPSTDYHPPNCIAPAHTRPLLSRPLLSRPLLSLPSSPPPNIPTSTQQQSQLPTPTSAAHWREGKGRGQPAATEGLGWPSTILTSPSCGPTTCTSAG